MATQPPPNMPLFYKELQPLSSSVHGNIKTRTSDKAPFFAKSHAIPLTVDEFISAQRFYPIVFSVGDNPVPLGLLGLNEGVNIFVDDKGKLLEPFYVPAYVRRYPWMLARLQPDAKELSLCYDPTSDLVGEMKTGNPLFSDGKPTEALNAVLKFCEDFEIAAQRTSAFMKELVDLDILIDGEVSIQPPDAAQPFIYRGFKMVSEEKFRDLPAETIEKINKSGLLPGIVAHLFSLNLIRDIFGRQMQSGKVPAQPSAAPASA